jgi:hypothetical protein
MNNDSKDKKQVVALFGDIINPNFLLLLLSAAITFIIVYLLKEYHISYEISAFLLPNNKMFYLVIITPIVEELLKFSAYAFIFIPIIFKLFNNSKSLSSNSTKDFIKRNIFWMALIVGIFFGLFEGLLYLDMNETAGHVLAHIVTHSIFIISPVLYWKYFKKNILLFFSIAIIMHALSNYRYVTSLLTWPIIIILFIIPIFSWWKEFKLKYQDKKISWFKNVS